MVFLTTFTDLGPNPTHCFGSSWYAANNYGINKKERPDVVTEVLSAARRICHWVGDSVRTNVMEPSLGQPPATKQALRGLTRD